MMQPDDELCLCFHVTRRKVENYLRVNRLVRASQLSECYGAGTGCGWCRPFLIRFYEAQQASLQGRESGDLPSAREYALGRAKHVRSGGGVPPVGATPLPEDDSSSAADLSPDHDSPGETP